MKLDDLTTVQTPSAIYIQFKSSRDRKIPPLSRFILTLMYSSSPRVFVVDWLSVKELNQRGTYKKRYLKCL